MMPATKKRKLPAKTIPNPDFLNDPDVKDAVEEAIIQRHMALGSMAKAENPFDLVDGMHSEIWSALPERGGCEIPEEGTWVIVKRPPHTELDFRFEVPALSIWRARPTYRSQEIRLGGPGTLTRKTTVKWPMLMGIINTPGGELWLYPGEYISTDIGVWLEHLGKGINVHFLGAGQPGELGDQLFYLMAHGIPRCEALLLLLPKLSDQDFAYFTIDLEDANG